MVRQVTAALAVFALAIAGCGDSSPAEGQSGNAYDRAFIAAMIPHHEGAIEMAEIAEAESQGEFAQELAASIVASQSQEIKQLKQIDVRLADAGVEQGDLDMSEEEMGMDHDASSLKGAKPFDEEFLTMMIPHHEGAITMSQALLENGSDPELRKLAEQIIAAQKSEIAQMREQLEASPGELDEAGDADQEHQH